MILQGRGEQEVCTLKVMEATNPGAALVGKMGREGEAYGASSGSRGALA